MQLLKAYLLATCFATLAHAQTDEASRPKLQFLNGSEEVAKIFWLSPEGEKISNGEIKPGENSIITTTLGHRFEISGKESGTKFEVESEVLVQGFRFDPPSDTGIPDFYSQKIEAKGFPIVASKTVNPYALKEAAFLVNQMLAEREDVRTALIKGGARLCIIAYDEFTTDLPEFKNIGINAPKERYLGVSRKEFWDARARGTGGSPTDPYCTCGEENLLGYPGDPYAAENILIHEFAHCIHLRGLCNTDPTFDKRLKVIYDKAMEEGLWKNKYAATNRFEYFAEGVQSWFGDNRENDHDHNHVNTRAELVEYDPRLAKICEEVFGKTELVYTKPATRLTGHMKGYDPSKAPTFKWPERLLKAKAAIRESARKADEPKEE
ncbi:MAG: hypothetical protein AB8D78_10330 [Akkermansiaceae bacterium]